MCVHVLELVLLSRVASYFHTDQNYNMLFVMTLSGMPSTSQFCLCLFWVFFGKKMLGVVVGGRNLGWIPKYKIDLHESGGYCMLTQAFHAYEQPIGIPA